jgi:uncharacterized protein
MLFALICTDKPDGLATRLERRPEHVAYLKSLGDKLAFAGPFLKEDGKTMCGSLVVVEAESLEAARAIADADPFAKASCSRGSRSSLGFGCWGSPKESNHDVLAAEIGA